MIIPNLTIRLLKIRNGRARIRKMNTEFPIIKSEVESAKDS